MNIFVLSKDPAEAAAYHCDVHINKMIVESCQLLHGAIRIAYYQHHPKPGLLPGDIVELDSNNLPVIVSNEFLKLTHAEHPCAKVVRASLANYLWVEELMEHLNIIWLNWRGKEHNTVLRHRELKEKYPNIFHLARGQLSNQDLDFSFWPRAMPIQYYHRNVVDSYRTYYTAKLSTWLKTPGKEKYALYTNRPVPSWLEHIYGDYND